MSAPEGGPDRDTVSEIIFDMHEDLGRIKSAINALMAVLALQRGDGGVSFYAVDVAVEILDRGYCSFAEKWQRPLDLTRPAEPDGA